MRYKTTFILTLLLSLSALLSYGQKEVEVFNGYKYIYLPPLTYQNGGVDIYGIASNTRSYFTEKGFGILVDKSEPNNIPKEVKENPCLVLTCQIEHPSPNGFSNSVTLTFLNCKNQLVYKTKGSGSMGMNVEGDYRIAVRKALKDFSSLKYRYTNSLTPEIEYPKVETSNETENSLKTYFDTNKIDVLEGVYKSYQSESLGYYKFAIKKKDGKYIAIILEADNKIWKPGEIKATFEISSMTGFYSVKWYMGDKTPFETFGALENEALLSIEFKEQNGQKKQDKFIKMYPAADSKTTFKKSSGASGSGFFLSANGLIATNAHVVEGAKSIEINLSNELGNFTYKAKLVLIDSKNDVAIIRIEDETFKGLNPLPYGISEKAEIGEKAFTIGYPLNDIMGTNYKLTDGIISAKSGIADDVRYYQISVPLQPGNSGGPLFNKEGNIIGITSAKLNSKAVGTTIENVNYAIKSIYLTGLMNMLPDLNIPAPSNQLTNKELKDQVKILKNYVCIINTN